MPTYSYHCTECDHRFEQVQRITEDPLRICPACGRPGAQREITSANFILKGGGWYADLYSGSSNRAAGGSSSASSTCANGSGTNGSSGSTTTPAPAPASSTSGDSKPAAPSTTTSTTTGSTS